MTQTLEVLPAPPIQNFIASLQGEFKTNSFDLWSYLAVVRIPLTIEPWPNSVNAKHPTSSPFSSLYFQSLCYSVPKISIVLYPNYRLTVNFTATSGDNIPIGFKSNKNFETLFRHSFNG